MKNSGAYQMEIIKSINIWSGFCPDICIRVDISQYVKLQRIFQRIRLLFYYFMNDDDVQPI